MAAKKFMAVRGFQCITLALVFIMGMFITFYMFLTNPAVKVHTRYNFKTASATVSSWIARASGNENMRLLSGDKPNEDFLLDDKPDEDVHPDDEPDEDVLLDDEADEDVLSNDEQDEDVLPNNKDNTVAMTQAKTISENEDNESDNRKSSPDQLKYESSRERKKNKADASRDKERKDRVLKRDVPLWGKIDEQDLLRIFDGKLKNITGRKHVQAETCFNKRTVSNSCNKDGCLQMKLPERPSDRIAQLIHRPGLTLTDSQHEVISEMASKVTETYDIILLTTASSNHFFESQALLQNLHTKVFPTLKNFALLFYDLGLTSKERKEMERFCRCTVLTFPFDKLPKHVRTLKCYAWKPLMIKAHIRQANVVLWLDASIRFNGDGSQIHSMIKRVRERGVQIGRSAADTTFRTFRSMYHYFGDEPCIYLGMGQAQATIGGYHSEPFIERIVLEPWVACGLNRDCMCPDTDRSAGCAESKKMVANMEEHNGPIIYGLCHRFDQSAITLILHKLYQVHYRWVMMRVKEYVEILRDNQVKYFERLHK